jgi:hypothetical protein
MELFIVLLIDHCERSLPTEKQLQILPTELSHSHVQSRGFGLAPSPLWNTEQFMGNGIT